MTEHYNIDEIISRFASGEASPEEAMWLEDWKKQSAENLEYYETSMQVFELLSEPQKKIDVQAGWKRVQLGMKDESIIIPIWKKYTAIKVAATLFLVVGISALFFILSKRNIQDSENFAEGDQPIERILDGGTKVILAGKSEMIEHIDLQTKERIIKLKGSAKFDVGSTDSLTLLIDMNGVFIRDIGTKFEIKTSLNEDTILVKVDEGIVLLFDSLSSEIMIHAQENALYIRSSRQIIPGVQSMHPVYLKFRNARLADVVKQLNMTYKMNIQIENAVLNECKLTSNFTDEDPETILIIITETLGLKFEKTNSGYSIKGEKCGG